MQVCWWHKFARYWDRDNYVSKQLDNDTTSCILERCDKNTIDGFVPTLGVTFTGKYELVEELCKVLDDFEKQIGLDILFHVDAVS